MTTQISLIDTELQNKALTSHEISIKRPVWSEELFARKFPSSDEEELSCYEHLKRRVRCQFSTHALTKYFPIFEWLPGYSLGRDGVADVCGGLTVGIMHVPQGLAFAMLASLPAVTGLYTALLPVFIYMVMGTSRYLSQGSFAVICLMVAQVIEREVVNISQPTSSNTSHVTENASSYIPGSTEGSLWSPIDSIKIEIAVSLALLIGFIQVAMGVVRLGFVANYLSDPVISGFTTGAAVVVVISQIKHILGLTIPQITGLFTSVKTVIYMFKNIAATNIGALITGVLCIGALLGIKYVNERFNKRLLIPIPAELLVVVIATAISYGGSIESNFGVQILGHIPKGLPPISIPSFKLMQNIVPDAFVITIVIFATNISLSKMFAKKNKQKIDANQELIAYGACNIGASFFSSFPICNAMARTAVQENLAHTQLCSIVVVGLVLLVLIFMTKLFFHLPKAVLAAVIIANLAGLLKQFSRIKYLWIICHADCIVWLVTCFGVILLGVANGLGCGVLSAVLAVLLRSSSPKHYILGSIPYTGVYRNINECPMAKEIPGIKIIRYESPLYYANIEHFKELLQETVLSLSNGVKRTSEAVVESYDNPIVPDEREIAGIENLNDTTKKKDILSTVHTVIIDASPFTNIDSMGILALSTITQEYKRQEIQIYLANCSEHLRNRLTSVKDGVDASMMFISIHDAVMSCRLRELQQNEIESHTTAL